MVLLIVFIVLVVGVSFLCSIMEAALLSVTPSYAAALAEAGHAAGARLRKLKGDIEPPLVAILSLNTVANTAGAVVIGAQADAVFGSAWVGVMSAVLTLLILVCSEIIPKTLGAAYWRRLAPALSGLLMMLVTAMRPFIWVAGWITRRLTPGSDEDAVSPDEIAAMATLGEEQGIFAEGESQILQNLMKLRRLRASEIMTPRTVATMLPEAETVAGVVEQIERCQFSRLPVYGDSEDVITGYVLRDDVLLAAARGDSDRPLAAFRHPLEVVPGSLRLTALFDRLLSTNTLIAVVVDEYGAISGVVTLEDLVETLVGSEIVDEVDRAPDMQELARRKWRRRSKRAGLLTENDVDQLR